MVRFIAAFFIALAWASCAFAQLPGGGGGGSGGSVTVTSSVLPTGASTSANQSTAITALNSIVSNTAAAQPLPAIAPAAAGSAASSLSLKGSAGTLYGAYATCSAACWLMLFNTATTPTNGATTAGIASGNLQDCITIGAGQSGSINYAPGPGETFANGIYAAVSSTACATLTLSTVGFIHGSVQ